MEERRTCTACKVSKLTSQYRVSMLKSKNGLHILNKCCNSCLEKRAKNPGQAKPAKAVIAAKIPSCAPPDGIPWPATTTM